ncbi:MAG: hypothetical protein PF487_03535 [Bacteroidales bacterium]|jgi:hypothetical protein|nr:hypothetical protein [Bacteroidales bacterium]
MYKIEYSVGLNEQGRPCIELPEDYEQRPEDRFFALEVTRWMLQDLLTRRTQDLDQKTVSAMDEAERLIGQLGDEVADILYGSMKAQGELDLMLDKFYHINVNSIEERDALPDKNIFFNDKLFDRVEGLCVQVNNTSTYYMTHDLMPIVEMYKLVGGITNEHWIRLSTEEINKKWSKI